MILWYRVDWFHNEACRVARGTNGFPVEDEMSLDIVMISSKCYAIRTSANPASINHKAVRTMLA